MSSALLQSGHQVIGVDNFNDYYNPILKRARLSGIRENSNFQLFEIDISDTKKITNLISSERPQRVVHLAAQAGIRQAFSDPHKYGQANLVGFLNVIEASANCEVDHFVYASTSSVYGSNSTTPFSEEHSATHPVSLYSATKIANEAIAHSYSATHNLACTGLRFFTVYGPWGRPDMAPIKFAKAIISELPIQIYNHGKHSRDFTYIDDIVNGVKLVVDNPSQPNSNYSQAKPNSATSNFPWRVLNIGGESPIALMEFVTKLEKALKRKARIEFVDKQIGDMDKTAADCSALRSATGWAPKVSLDEGLSNLANWCQSHQDLL